MDFNYKICFYEEEKTLFSEKINIEIINCFGFDSNVFTGSIQEFLSHLSNNTYDILAINVKKVNNERMLYLINVLEKNYCKNILILTESYSESLNVYQMALNDFNNIDLKLINKLMDIKREIQSNPSKNIMVLQSKVNNILNGFQFSPRHDGFKYYRDAVILAYMKYPCHYFTMDLYKEVANMYGKTLSAVEKSMRVALLYAFNKLKNAPNTPEFNKLRTQLTYDLNNNTAISMILNLLLNDEDIKEDLINQKEFVFRR